MRGRRRRRSRSVHNDRVGWAIEPRKIRARRGRAGGNRRRQHVRSRFARGRRSAVVKDPITHERIASEPGRPRLARSRAQRCRATAGRRGAEAAVEQARSRTSLVVPMKHPNKAARSGGGGRGGKGARSEGWQTVGGAPDTELEQAHVPTACQRIRLRRLRLRPDHARPLARARCGKAARRDLCGGQGVIPVPTATDRPQNVPVRPGREFFRNPLESFSFSERFFRNRPKIGWFACGLRPIAETRLIE